METDRQIDILLTERKSIPIYLSRLIYMETAVFFLQFEIIIKVLILALSYSFNTYVMGLLLIQSH